jgi:hypothetical protein
MMAAVAVGVYRSMDDCIADWVTPLLGDAEIPDAAEAARFDRLFSAYGRSPGNGARLGHACRSRNVFVADRRVNQVLMQQGIEGA